MAAARPTVSVFDGVTGKPSTTVPLPAVFLAPIRRDVVHFVHTNIRKNSRQAYAATYSAGEQTSAMSWGTGRAVARIPRVGGGGTGRSGQGAYGNMCRGGRMFAPTKIWRRWHRHVNVGQRRYAIVSALAASAVPALVQARGHRIDGLEEVPLVLNGLATLSKTKEAVALLKTVGAYADIERVIASKKLRAGQGKGRNRRFVQRRGPLVIYGDDTPTLAQAFRNIPGVDLVHIDRLNLLQLAPGGHLGRFCVWTQGAFLHLEQLFGTATSAAPLKKGFLLPRAPIANADLARLINSTEIQSVVRPALRGSTRLSRQRKNPLRNHKAMVKLNPYAAVTRKAEMEAAAARATAKAARVAAKGAGVKKTAAPKKKAPPAKAAAGETVHTRNNKKARALSKAVYASFTAEEYKRPADFLKA